MSEFWFGSLYEEMREPQGDLFDDVLAPRLDDAHRALQEMDYVFRDEGALLLDKDVENERDLYAFSRVADQLISRVASKEERVRWLMDDEVLHLIGDNKILDKNHFERLDLGDLTHADRVELLRHRCFVTGRHDVGREHPDRSTDFRYEEPNSTA